MYMCVFKFFYEITEPTEDKVHVGHHGLGEKIYSNDSGQLLFFILILSAPQAGAFSGEFTTNFARQCRAFSRALKIENLRAPLFRGPVGPGLQMTGALCLCVFLLHNIKPRREKTVFFFFCICENKDTDQLRGSREADQRLCFRYIDSTIPLLPKSEISSL